MIYCIEKHDLDRLRAVAKRLYTENRLNGDEMRDLAQAVDVVCNNAFELEEDKESDKEWRPDPIYAAGYAYACGYYD